MSSEKDRTTATVTCAKDLVKFGHVIFEIYGRTDKQTDTLITILCIRARTKINIHYELEISKFISFRLLMFTVNFIKQ